MLRITQTKEQLIEQLGEVTTDWKDDFAIVFLKFLDDFDFEGLAKESHLIQILNKNYEAGITLFRIVLEQSKDEFTETLKALFFNNIDGSIDSKNGR